MYMWYSISIAHGSIAYVAPQVSQDFVRRSWHFGANSRPVWQGENKDLSGPIDAVAGSNQLYAATSWSELKWCANLPVQRNHLGTQSHRRNQQFRIRRLLKSKALKAQQEKHHWNRMNYLHWRGGCKETTQQISDLGHRFLRWISQQQIKMACKLQNNPATNQPDCSDNPYHPLPFSCWNRYVDYQWLSCVADLFLNHQMGSFH